MKRFPLLIMFFCLGITLSTAQERGIVQGYCKDENGKPIENVSVYVNDSLLIAITDENGCFTYTHAETGLKLRFAHMAYEPTYYTIKAEDQSGKPINIRIKTRSHELLEVQVTANAPQIAFDNPVMSILDYVICDDGIYMIAYRRRNSALLHLSFEMDTLHELRISSEYKYIIKDFYGFVHVVSDDKVCQVGFSGWSEGEKREMFLHPPMAISKFYELFSPIITASDSVVITGRYVFYGLEQYFYCVTPTADTMYLLHHIVDEQQRDDLLAMMRSKGGLDRYTTYMLSLYPKLNYIYNPIYGIDNKFYLFAFTDSEVLVFDAVGNELERHPLTFHMLKTWNGKVVLDKRWKKKMMADEARKEFYTFFVDDGLYTIMHIDMETGLASPVIDLKGYPFAESLHVHNGMLYFLYPTGNNHRRALYRVKLE